MTQTNEANDIDALYNNQPCRIEDRDGYTLINPVRLVPRYESVNYNRRYETCIGSYLVGKTAGGLIRVSTYYGDVHGITLTMDDARELVKALNQRIKGQE